MNDSATKCHRLHVSRSAWVCAYAFSPLVPYNLVDWMLSSFIYIYKDTLLNIFCDITAMNVWTGVQTRIVNTTYCYSYHLCVTLFYWCHHGSSTTLILVLCQTFFHSFTEIITIAQRLAAGTSLSLSLSLRSSSRSCAMIKYLLPEFQTK